MNDIRKKQLGSLRKRKLSFDTKNFMRNASMRF